MAQKGLAGTDASSRDGYMFSLLRVFGPTAASSDVDEAEAHYKRALLTQAPFGFNLN